MEGGAFPSFIYSGCAGMDASLPCYSGSKGGYVQARTRVATHGAAHGLRAPLDARLMHTNVRTHARGRMPHALAECVPFVALCMILPRCVWHQVVTLDTGSAYAPTADVGSYHYALAFTASGVYNPSDSTDYDEYIPGWPDDVEGLTTPASTGDVFTFTAWCRCSETHVTSVAQLVVHSGYPGLANPHDGSTSSASGYVTCTSTSWTQLSVTHNV